MDPKNIRLLFVAPDLDSPSGGRKHIYHTVDELNRNGIESYALHACKGFRYTWFNNETPTLVSNALAANGSRRRRWYRFVRNRVGRSAENQSTLDQFRPGDILVLPETRLKTINLFPAWLPKVIFNQGHYLTFSQVLPEAMLSERQKYLQSVVAIMVVSQQNYEWQKFVFPETPIYRTRLLIEQSFVPPKNRKKLQLAFMSRRGSEDLMCLIQILRLRGQVPQLELVSIEGVSHQRVQQILQSSLLYATFSNREGFGLPAAEAMASGCLVVGNNGGGGSEFMLPEFSYPIEDGDLLTAVRTIESLVKKFLSDPRELVEKGMRASDWIRGRHDPESVKTELVETWRKLIEKIE